MLTILVLCLFSVGTVACNKDDSLDAVRKRGSLRIGMDASFPPFEVVTAEGDLAGLDVDLGKMLSAQLGVQAEFRNIAFDGLYDALAAGQVDLLLSALPYDNLRTQDVVYSQPYFQDGIVIFGAAGRQPPALNKLNGRLAVEMGSESAALAQQLGDNGVGKITIKEYYSEAETLSAVSSDQADWGLADKLTVCADTRNYTIGEQTALQSYSLVMRSQDRGLQTALLKAFESVLSSQEWHTSYKQWLGEGC